MALEDLEVWVCKFCEEKFSDNDDRLLVCERCEKPVCLPCTDGVSVEEYSVLSRAGTQCHWYCKDCDKAAVAAVRTDNIIEQRCGFYINILSAEVEEKFKEVSVALNGIQTRMSLMCEKQSSCVDRDTLDTRLSALQKQIDEVKESQKNKPLFSHVVKKNGEGSLAVGGEEEKAHVINDSAREIEDRESRKNKLIWFGVPEHASDDVEVRKKADAQFVAELGKKVYDFQGEVFKTVVRLGKKGDKPRPLLTVVSSADMISKILREAKAIRQHADYAGISVKRDMTPLERAEQRKLVSLRNQKREEAETNATGEWFIIRKGKVVNVSRRTTPTTGAKTDGE
jgi:hypothetical protein